eukprot:CAMPEP_0113582098 /NCGR_PEP_ID=MMETSP0015_2-20120614/31702_1 /TAXON_ID=2838 /ORGANISM="Odontella" /LENGTH=969 /DNA_ID=CAMNT_0000486685 /DNA_START=195 /DNA_END=3101 /DNA_ORIENTATION=+ /assembly_acc=CAM_ASM_000160
MKQRRFVGRSTQRGCACSPVVVDLLSASSLAARSEDGIASLESARSKKRKRALQRKQHGVSYPGNASERSEPKPRRDSGWMNDIGSDKPLRGTNARDNEMARNEAVKISRYGRKGVNESGSTTIRHGDRGCRSGGNNINDSNRKKPRTAQSESWMEDAIDLSSSEENDFAYAQHTKNKNCNITKNPCAVSRDSEKAEKVRVLSLSGSRGNEEERRMSSEFSVASRGECRTDGTKTSEVHKFHQTTLFGKIVRNIQTKDLSTCSKYTRLHNAAESEPISSSGLESPKQKVSTLPFPKTQALPRMTVETLSSERLKSLLAQADTIMKDTFRIPSLRNFQPQAIRGALNGQNQIVVMATGGGKSLCYQLPATVLPGVTVVVAPLIALMVDQVSALNDRGIPAALLSSANTEQENTEVLQRLVGRKKNVTKRSEARSCVDTDAAALKPIKLVYCTPELIETTRFRAILTELFRKGKLSLFAIDEAHCLSTWGHDFRPAYRKLNWVRASMPSVPCMACTATATPKVISDIRENLNMTDSPCHMSTFNRSNISYEVRYKANIDAAKPRGAIGDLVDVVRQQHAGARSRKEKCSGIVYVHKRDDTQMLAHRLSREAGVKAAPYHGGLKDTQRSDIQQKWTAGQVDVAVATVAFGMGIDLPHVRYVLHWSMAKTVEGFYQESGRGGRDGRPALSILYYSREDASKFAFIIKKSNERKQNSKAGTNDERSLTALQGMVNYCIHPGCRRKYLLKHFGEDIKPKTVCKRTCDHCKNPGKVESDMNMSAISQDVMNMTARQKSSGRTPHEWDGQWSRPHGDNNHVSNKELGGWERDEGELRINHSNGGELCNRVKTRNEPSSFGGFVKAKSILDKFEVMEMEEGCKGGFVNFKAKEAPKKMAQVRVPEHMRTNMPDPLHAMTKNSSKDKKISTDTSSNLDQLKAELEKLRVEKAARLAKLQQRKSSGAISSPTFAAPPSLS